MSDLARVTILSEALPYLQRFRNKTIVIKYGGAAMKDPVLKESVIKDLVLLACVGVRPVLVHGGGPEINTWLAKVGIEPNFNNGLRVTGPSFDPWRRYGSKQHDILTTGNRSTSNGFSITDLSIGAGYRCEELYTAVCARVMCYNCNLTLNETALARWLYKYDHDP